MSNVSKEKLKIYETLLSSPGMGEPIKVVLHVSRQNIIALCRLIETGLTTDKENPDFLVGLLTKESKEELESVMQVLLEKGYLTEFYNNLKSL